MASIIIIPLVIVAIAGLSGYLVYKFVIYDMYCKRNVHRILRRYDIRKTPSQIIREYYDVRGESISYEKICNLEKNYRQNEPDQFLAMYDSIIGERRNKEKD